MIAIIAAMSQEVEAIIDRMKEVKKQDYYQTLFYSGILGNYPVVVMQSGVAKVAAAMSTTQLFEHFDVEGVINIGTAGGLMNNQNVLDIVISTHVAFHDLEVPGESWEKSFTNERFCYASDPYYVEKLKEIVSESKDTVWVGPMVTGDCFVCTRPQVMGIKKYFPEALCAEMEAASIASVCQYYQKPFVVIRSLSDVPGQDKIELTFDKYLQRASARSALWCEKAVSVLSEKGPSLD